MVEKMIDQKHLLPKKRCYRLAFPETGTETEESPPSKQFCIRPKREPDEDKEVKTEDEVKPSNVMLSGDGVASAPTVKRECPGPLSFGIESQKTQNANQPNEGINPTAALLGYIKLALGGDQEVSDVQLIMQRNLEYSDIDTNQARLAIPCDQVINTNFLSESEKGWLQLNNGKGNKNRLGVKVFGSSLLPEHELDLTRWDYAEGKNGENRKYKYVLNNGWNKFGKENDLKEDQMIQLWSFRYKGRVCFAIVGLEKEKKMKMKMKMKRISPIQRYLAGLKWKTRPRSRRIVAQ